MGWVKASCNDDMVRGGKPKTDKDRLEKRLAIRKLVKRVNFLVQITKKENRIKERDKENPRRS